MDQPSFTNVPQDGFLGLGEELDQGAWAAIDVSTFLAADGALLLPIGTAPVITFFKIDLLTAIYALSSARAATYGATGLDRIWDSLQRQLNLTLSTAATDPDANKRAAATRLQKLLLIGGGTGQTRLKFHLEVDFGRKQLKVTSEGQAANDVKLLGLEALMASISKATEDLAAGIGHGATQDRPSEQSRGALSECVRACTWVAEGLSRLATRGQPGADRDTAANLLASLATLAARYPTPPPKEKKAEAGAAGASAAAGASGATGPSGPSTAAGPAGPKAATGAAGASAATGATGAIGATGATAAGGTGSAGPSGS